MHIENLPIDSIRPYPNNPRVLRNAAEKVAESIRNFGWRQPIVVDTDMVVVIGHARLAAASLLKLDTVPVHVAEGLSADQVRALRIADNKTSTFADWDDGKLSDELQAIMAGIGNVTITGFSQAEFDQLEMQAKATLATITGGQSDEIGEDEDEDDFNIGGDDTDEPAESAQEETEEPQATEVRRDLVPFNCLMDVDARQVVYDAIAKAKQKHGLETTADALVAISREYASVA